MFDVRARVHFAIFLLGAPPAPHAALAFTCSSSYDASVAASISIGGRSVPIYSRRNPLQKNLSKSTGWGMVSGRLASQRPWFWLT